MRLAQQVGHFAMQDASARFQAAFAQACRLHEAGRLDEAIAWYDEVLGIAPDFVGALYNRGNAQLARGRAAEASENYRRAVALVPDFAEAHINLGIALQGRGAPDDAIACLRTAIRLRPDLPQAHDSLGNALHATGALAEAAACHRAALALRPDFAEAHANLGNVLHAQGLFDQAIACHRAFVALRPNDPGGHANLGNALLDVGRCEEAIACHRGAIALNPDEASFHNNLGNALQQRGDLDAAFEAFTSAVTRAPRHGLFHRMLATTGRLAPDNPATERMEALLRDPTLPRIDRLELRFALGTVYGEAGRGDIAFPHLLAGNKLQRERIAYDEAATMATLARIAAIFSRDFLTSHASAGMASDRPVFVVGMPRSGTTLVEQILASHPDIFGAGELPDLPRLTGPFDDPAALAGLSAEELRGLGAAYLKAMAARAPDSASRVVDKLPDNFRRIGLIRLILPRARIIHVRRDPVDTCLSCFSKLFSGHVPYSYDLGELGRYFRAYEHLMDHWRDVLPPGVMLEIRYEDLVGHPAREIRRLLAHCGVGWDERCLAFHETPRPVSTASNAQVRRPLYGGAVGRWHDMAALARPLLDALAGGPRQLSYETAGD